MIYFVVQITKNTPCLKSLMSLFGSPEAANWKEIDVLLRLCSTTSAQSDNSSVLSEPLIHLDLVRWSHHSQTQFMLF